jgi:hypothetical protein
MTYDEHVVTFSKAACTGLTADDFAGCSVCQMFSQKGRANASVPQNVNENPCDDTVLTLTRLQSVSQNIVTFFHLMYLIFVAKLVNHFTSLASIMRRA